MNGWLVSAVPILLLSAGPSPEPDRYCGSRAVHFLCRHYGDKNLDLIDVIRELQPATESDEPEAARLGDMNGFLVRRGIWAAPMEVDFSVIADVREPVIVFLPDHKENPAHYVVLVPQKIGGNVKLWNGLAGYVAMNAREFRGRASGECIVTARTAPSQWQDFFVFKKSSGVTLNWPRAVAFSLVLLSSALACRRFRFGRVFSKEDKR